MSDYNSICGPNAIDEYDYATRYSDNTYRRTHWVRGTGAMTSNNASGSSSYCESYQICSGISELGDSCLSRHGIDSVSLPTTLIKIGSSCFRSSRITLIPQLSA